MLIVSVNDWVSSEKKYVAPALPNLPSYLDPWSVSIHNETSEGLAGWAFRINVSPGQQEVPKLN